MPDGFYFGKFGGVGSLTYTLAEARQTESDTITFGLQTLSDSVPVFRLESDSQLHSLQYEIVGSESSRVRSCSSLCCRFADDRTSN